MTGRYWLWGTAAIPIGMTALVWLMMSAGSEPEAAGGMVTIASNTPTPVASPGSAPAEVKRIPIVATHQTVTLADDQSYLVAREKRDAGWAGRSEAAIRERMQGIAYIGGRRRLAIKCAATACEVVGIVDLDPAAGSYAPHWEALERDTAGDELRQYGLARVSAIFDTGRNPDEFKISYRRVPAVPDQ